jgi:uncharacterized protein (DUF169 family)
MTTLKELNRYGEDLERLLLLRTSPLAVKMLEREEDVPEGAIRPKKDRGIHLAQCQAFTMSRRKRVSVAMLKEDNWCFAPLIAYGMVDKPDDPMLEKIVAFPCLERNKYVGIVSAPLKTANFEPDVVLIYSNTAQLRNMLLPSHFKDEPIVNSHFFPPACSYIIVPVMEKGQYLVTLPDPGEAERAMAGEDEIILSVPAGKLEEMVSGVREYDDRKAGYVYSGGEMMPDFPRPEFYQMLFKRWGLDTED